MFLRFTFGKSLMVCLILSIFAAGSVLAQSAAVYGTVLDKTAKEALPGASVLVKGTNIGAVSDLDGKYLLRNVPSGRHTLIVSYIGYVPDSIIVNVPRGGTLKQDFSLVVTTIKGEEIVITAQAQGQISAIQQQLTSNKIVNVVSEQKIQELPDFNAAQAISRLPGVSTLQSSGEANKIVVRGLAPQYNQVTIGGIGLASTGSAQIGIASQGGTAGNISNDRSVDLSMITPYMIKTISVYKSLTPDLNANAIGGSVNMELREAPDSFHSDVLWQSGYTQKSGKYGNYRGVASASQRFFDGDLGVYALGNIESYDRNADNMNANYNITSSTNIGANGYLPVRVTSITLQRHVETRKRYGANLILDYRLPNGSIKSVNMFSRLNSKYQNYSQVLNYQTGDVNFRYGEGDNNVDVAVNSLGLTNDFGFMTMDLKVASNYSRNFLPFSPAFNFIQTGGVGTSGDNVTPENLGYLTKFKGTQNTYLTDLSLFSSDYKENNQAYKGDFKIPFNFNNVLTGYFKFGGEFQYKLHHNQQNTPYAGLRGGSAIANAMINGIRANFPGLSYDSSAAEFRASNFVNSDSDLTSDFLGNRFGRLLYVVDPSRLTQITNYISGVPSFSADSATSINPGGWFNGYFQTLPNTYKYIEKYSAAYLMAELNWNNLMIVGGVRYENDDQLYEAFNLVDGRDNKSQRYYQVTVYPNNHFVLPMVQARYMFADWFDLRYSYTQTLARPDYHQLSPHYTIDYTRFTVNAGNPRLKPAQAYNHDLILTIHSNEIGLLSIGGFYKTIKNFTYATSYVLFKSGSPGLDSVASYNIGGVTPNEGANLFTFVNSPYDAFVKGVEVDFQTRLWYLPQPLDGIVLGVNYTHISSSATYPWHNVKTILRPRPLPLLNIVIDSTRGGRLINQPNDILNAYVGYDYKGFSIRLSFLFQGNSVSGIGAFAEQDGFSRDYFRMDASVKQQLPDWFGFGKLEAFLDLNNLNNRNNLSAQASINGFTNEQNYGLTMNLGFRFRM